MDYRNYYKKMAELVEKELSGELVGKQEESKGFVSKPSKKEKKEKKEEQSVDQIVMDYMKMFRKQAQEIMNATS